MATTVNSRFQIFSPKLHCSYMKIRGRIHHVMWSFSAKFWQKTAEIVSVNDVWEPWKQALLASRDVIISSQFAARIRRGFFTLGDGCWLPIKDVSQSRKCAINNLRTKNPRGLLGWGSRGSRQIIYVRIFPNIWSVFETTSRPNINNFRDRRPA